jgi:hypothetical protein
MSNITKEGSRNPLSNNDRSGAFRIGQGTAVKRLLAPRRPGAVGRVGGSARAAPDEEMTEFEVSYRLWRPEVQVIKEVRAITRARPEGRQDLWKACPSLSRRRFSKAIGGGHQ